MTGIQDINEEDIWNEIDDEGNIVGIGEGDGEPAPEDLPGDLPEEDLPEDLPEEDSTPTEEDLPADSPEEVLDYKALWDKAQSDRESAIGRAKAAEQKLQQFQERMAPPKEVQPTEEDQFLEKFRSEYNDDVVKAINIIANRSAAAIADQYIAQRVAPVEQTTMNMVEQAHFGAIEAAHPDVYEIDQSPQFDSWIETRPMHIRGAYQFVREQGTPAEVISMLNEYKQSIAPKGRQNAAPPSDTKVNPAVAVPRRRGTTPVAAEPAITDEKELWDSIPD